MRSPVSFVVLSLTFVSLVVMSIIGNIPYWAWFIPVGIGIMATLTVFQGLYLPQKTVDRGMELIRSQDYNNRLVKVGEPYSDKIVSLFNSLIDKLREERLQNREQESLLTLLIDASPMGVAMLDFDHRISMVNRAFLKIIGFSKWSEAEGKKIHDIDNDLIPEMLKVPLGQSEIVRKGNFRIYRIYHLNFIQEGFKREFFLLESLTDEIMKAEKAAYEKVIRTISHEVNNTMGGVRSVLEIMAETTEDEDVKRVMESCDRRCESMGNFIREYAEVVKIPEPVITLIDLGNELDLMLPFLQQIVPPDVDLRYNRKNEPFFVKADSGLLQQVIVNIVKNAVESIPGEGFVELELSKPHNNVLLIISNNGSPITEEISLNLFTPFFTTKRDGKGIGLTLVREILKNHSADYSLSTLSDGITRFTIKFPE